MSAKSPSAEASLWILGLWWDLLGPTIVRGFLVWWYLLGAAAGAVCWAVRWKPDATLPPKSPEPLRSGHRRRRHPTPIAHATQYRAGRASVYEVDTVPLDEDTRAVAR